MNKKHSELEMFMRKFMNRLGLGYQCFYHNRSKKYQGWSGCYPGHWWIRIWDQRNGHYERIHKGEEGYNDSPSQKWYNNQSTDTWFDIIGPEYTGVGSEHKDDFLKWLLFNGDFFEKMCEKAIPNSECHDNDENDRKFISDFKSKETICIKNTLEGKDLSDIFDEYEKIKLKYT